MQTNATSLTFANHTLFCVNFAADTLHAADLLWLSHHAQLARAVPRRQAEHLAGRMAAVMALRHAGSEDSAPGIGAHREPLWPAGFTGSITHTAGVAMAVALKTANPADGVGIDLEALLDDADAYEIADDVVNPQERRLLEARALPFPLALTLAFSAKESLFKALFPQVGTWFGFDCAEVIALEEARLTLRLRRALGPLPPHALFTVHWQRRENHLLTLARL